MTAVRKYPVLVALVVGAAFMVLPFFVVLMNAVKSPEEYSSDGPLSMPDGVYLDGLADFWERVDFGQKLWNSVLISGSVAVLAVVLSVLSAYAIGIGRIRGRPYVLAFFVLANMLPQEALVYPVYYLSKEAGLYDTRLSVVIVFTVVQSAFGTYLLASVLGGFPREVIEAARIDGAGKWQVLWRVVVPVEQADDRRADGAVLHLDVERVPAAAGHARLRRQPDRVRRPRRPPGAAGHGRHDDERRRPAGRAAGDRVLPHLPADPDPRHRRGRGQVITVSPVVPHDVLPK